MMTLSHFLGTFIDILGMWVLFDRFKMVQGWTLYEVGLIYGIVHMGFAVADTFARGFDRFYLLVKRGDFDRVLLRPVSPLFQVAASDVQLLRLGRFLQGFILLVWSASHFSFSLLSYHSAVILLAIIGTASLFYGLMIIQATFAFWTTETLELMNITTFGGVQTAQYPISIYKKPIRLVFTFIIPLACVAYYPIATLLHHTSIPFFLGILAPVIGICFLFIASRFWRLGICRYQSTGS